MVKWLAERTANLANGRNKLAEKKKVEEEKDRGKIIMVVPILLFPPALTLVLAITLTGSLPSLPLPPLLHSISLGTRKTTLLSYPLDPGLLALKQSKPPHRIEKTLFVLARLFGSVEFTRPAERVNTNLALDHNKRG